MADKKINIEVGFITEKSNLKELESALDDIAIQAKVPGHELNESFQKAGQTAEKLKTILSKSFNTNLGTVNITKFNSELAKSGLTLKDVKNDFSKLGATGANAYNLIGINILKTNVQLKQTSKLLNDMAVTFKNTVRYGISSSVFNTMANSIQRAYDFSKQLNTSLNDIRIVTGQSADQMARFAEQANNAAKQMGATTLDYTKAALIYYQQGLSEQEVQARANVTIKAANVTGQSASDVSEQLTAVWNGYKVSAQETEAYIDKLAAVAATTASDLEELSVGMSKVAAAANNAGVDIDQMNAMLSTVISVTREAPETIGTSFRTLFARMGDLKLGLTDEDGATLGKVSGQLHNIGVEVLDVNGDMRDMGSILEDLAARWKTLTSAQQQAAAVSIGGKMQYSRLIALLDNWDMYTKAIETSKGAIGTLQKQQDIYMESTEAKLNTLQAAWEDFYKSLIKTDEVNAGIGAITNIVEVLDNFVDAFGGGGKSVLAFGTLVANVFNRQIGESIARTKLQFDSVAHNANLFKQMAETTNLGSLSGGDKSLQINLETQAEKAKEILEVQKGLNQEGIETLMNLQHDIGNLAQSLEEQEQKIENFKTQYKITSTEEGEALEQPYRAILGTLDDINEKTVKFKEGLEAVVDDTKIDIDQQKKAIEALLSSYAIFMDELPTDMKEVLNYDQQIWSVFEEIFETVQSADQTGAGAKKIVADIEASLKRVTKQTKESSENTNKQLEAAKKLNGLYKERDETKLKKDTQEGYFEAGIQGAKQTQSIIQNVSQVTSAVSTLTVAWSSIRMMYDTWNNETLSLGDKIFQTISSLAMFIPSIISSFKTLGDTLGITKAYQEAYNAAVEASKNIKKAETAEVEANNAVREGAKVIQTEEITLDGAEAASTTVNTEATVTNTGAKTANTGATTTNTGATMADVPAQKTDAGAKELNSAATAKLTAAMKVLTGTILTSPIFWMAAAVIGVVVAISALTKASEENTKAVKEQNDEKRKNLKAQQEEIDKTIELYNTYEKLYDKYKSGVTSKEEFKTETNKLIESLEDEHLKALALIGDYKALNEAIKEKKQQEREEEKENIQEQIEASSEDVITRSRQLGTDWARMTWYEEGENIAPGLHKKELGQKNLRGKVDINTGPLTKDEDAILAEIYKVRDRKGGFSNFFIDDSGFKDDKTLRFSMPQDYTPQNFIAWYEEIDDLVNNNLKLAFDRDVRESSEVYKNLEGLLEKYKEQYDALKENQEQLNQLAMGDFADEIDFSSENIKDYNDFVTKREAFITKVLENGLVDNYGDAAGKVDEYLKQNSEYAKDTYERIETWKALTDKLGNDYSKEIRNIVFSAKKEDLSYIVQIDEAGSLKNIDAIINIMKLKLQEVNIQSNLNVIGDALEKLNKGSSLTDKELEKLKALENEYQELKLIQDRYSNEYLTMLNKVQNYEEQRLTEIQVAKEKEILKAGQKTINDLKDKDGKIKVEADTTEAAKAINDLLNADYQTTITLKTDMDSDFNYALNQMEEAEKIAGYIGKDFIVSNDKLLELQAAFPGILDGITDLHNGTQRLSRESVQTALANSEAIIAETNIETIKRLQGEQEVVLAKMKSAQTIADLAGKLAKDEGQTAEEKNKLLGQLEDELSTYTTDVSKDTAEAKIENEAAVADSTDDNNAIMASNTANAFDSMAKNSQEYATEAIENIQAVVDRTAGKTGSTPKHTKIESHYWNGQGGSQEAKEKLSSYTPEEFQSHVNDTDYWKKVEANALNEVKAYQTIYDNITAQIARLSGGTSSLDDLFGNAVKGLGGENTGAGSGSDSKPSEKDLNKDELDIYHEINTELSILANELSDIAKKKEKAFGTEKIKLLNKEIVILNKEIDANNRKLDIMKEEAFGNKEKGTTGLQQKLAARGVLFDEQTQQISNYNEVWNTYQAIVNKAIQSYNEMSKEAQEAYEKELKTIEDGWEEFKEDLDRYDTIVSKDMHEVQSTIDDKLSQIIADNIEKFNAEINIRLDMQDAIKDWDKFRREVIDDWKNIWKVGTFDDTNIIEKARKDIDLLNTYFEKSFTSLYTGNTAQGSGLVSVQANHLRELTEEVYKAFDSDGGLFGTETQTAMDNLKEFKDSAISTATEIKELIDEIKDSYLNMLNEANEKFEDQVSMYERIDKYIEHDMKLIKLLYGDKQYQTLGKYYQKQHENNLQQLDFQVKEIAFWKEQMEYAEKDSREWKYAKEQYLAAIESANAALEQTIEGAKAKWENAIDNVFQKLENKFTDNLGMDYLEEEWNLINKNADEYLDAINSAYGIQKLQNKYLDAIDKTTDINNQRKLNDLMNSEVEYLQQIDRLTQTDLERAELKLQIALKQMELEDAQNNKTTMRLRRDSQGNYSYQFVANNDDIDKAKDELAELNNKLYNFDLKAYRENLNKAEQAGKEFLSKMAEAAKIIDPEERVAKETLLREQYYEYIGMLEDEYARYSQNLIESATTEHGELYNQEALDFKAMTDAEIDAFMNNLVPQWNSGVKDMIEQWSGKDGFKESVDKAITELEEKDEEYRKDLEEIDKTAGTVFDDIKNNADATRLDALIPFVEINDDLLDRYKKQSEEIRTDLIPRLEALRIKYWDLVEAIEAANRAQGIEYEEAANRASKERESNNSFSEDNTPVTISKGNPLDSNNTGSGADTSNKTEDLYVGKVISGWTGSYYRDSNGRPLIGTRVSGNPVVIDDKSSTDYGGYQKTGPYAIHISDAVTGGDLGWVRPEELEGYATGGYTGEWGNNGRLAFLHQKELVLNATDTSNFLNALEVMRNIVNNVGSSAFARLAAIGSGHEYNGTGAAPIEQNVVINADFPSVTDHNEIQEAFNNLLNVTTQRLYRNRL